MTLRHLKTFITVCETGSFSKAAELLDIAQPAVSQTISELEHYYNVNLFLRLNKKIILTKEGQELVKKAREVMKSFSEFEQLAQFKEEHPALAVGTSLTVSTVYLPDIIKTIHNNFPNIDFSAKVKNALEIQQQIDNGLIDFALIEGTPILGNIDYEILKEEELILIASTSFAIKEKISLKELSNYPTLLREQGSFSRDYLAKSTGIDITPMLESNSNQAIINSCLDGAGIAILPKSLVFHHLKNKKLKEIQIEETHLKALTTLIWHRKKIFSPLMQQVLSSVRDIVRKTN